MKFKKLLSAAALGTGLAVAGLGIGAGAASASATVPSAITHSGHDQFLFYGETVQPVYDASLGGWGFWYEGEWVQIMDPGNSSGAE